MIHCFSFPLVVDHDGGEGGRGLKEFNNDLSTDRHWESLPLFPLGLCFP